MQPIRVLLASMPRMLRDIIERVVATQSDMVVVGAFGALGALDAPDATAAAIAASLAGRSVDVMIVGRPSDEALGELDAVLYAHPRLTLLAITRDGRGAHLRRLRPHEEVIGDVSPEGLVAAIRGSRPAEPT